MCHVSGRIRHHTIHNLGYHLTMYHTMFLWGVCVCVCVCVGGGGGGGVKLKRHLPNYKPKAYNEDTLNVSAIILLPRAQTFLWGVPYCDRAELLGPKFSMRYRPTDTSPCTTWSHPDP